MCNSRGVQTAGYVHGPPMKNPLVIQDVDLVLNCSITLPKELQNIYSWLPLSLSLSLGIFRRLFRSLFLCTSLFY